MKLCSLTFGPGLPISVLLKRLESCGGAPLAPDSVLRGKVAVKLDTMIVMMIMVNAQEKYVNIVRKTGKGFQWYKVIYIRVKSSVERKYRQKMANGHHTCQKKGSKHVKRE